MAQNNTANSEENKILPIRVRIKKKPEPSAALYSEKDIRTIVDEFVTSWIRGDIIIRFPLASELSKQNPLTIAFPKDPSVSAELKIKEHYVDLLLVCAGVKPASNEEQQKAISEVFKMMLMFRSANRIEGKIISNDIEKRVTELEKIMQNQTKLIEQITGFLFKPKKSKQQRSES
ncbi:MAG: hypothetical protein ACQCN3_09350 [Candidatus Bathyarchaeia archaeon]